MRTRTNHNSLLVWALCALMVSAAAAIFWGTTPKVSAQHALTTTGRVGEFRAATAISPGILSIGSMRCEIRPGTVIEGQEMIRVGGTFSLKATMNDEDQIVVPSAVSSQDNSSISACGRVRTWWPSTYATAGRLTLDSTTWTIAPGVELRGAMQLSTDADVCVSGALNAAGQISYPNSITASATSTVQICGRVTAYSPATAGAQGSLAIENIAFTIARGAALPAGISVGANLCLTLCLNRSGEIFDIGYGAANSGPVSLCGYITAYSAGYWTAGSITIGGQTFPIAPGAQLQGQAMIGAYACLTPVIANGQLVNGSTITSSVPQQPSFAVTAVVEGTTGIYGPPNGTDLFLLPTPVVFNVKSPAPAGTSIFPVNNATFGPLPLLEGTRAQGLTLSTPNATVRAESCTDSFWDIVFHVASMGATDGDMVTLSLQNPNGSGSRVIAMLTLRNGGAELTQLHKDVTLLWSSQPRALGSFFPFYLPAGAAGSRSPELALVVSQSPTTTLNGCFQLVSEIKRASGAGKTSVVISQLQVKRMATPDDPAVSNGTSLITNTLGWYPTGKVCDFICGPCQQPPTPPGSLSGTVFCDNNDDGVQQAGEPGLAGVTITLSGAANRTTTTGSNGAYVFDNLQPGTYRITETQPAAETDGRETLGSLGGVVSNDMFSNIDLAANQSGVGYNFGEICSPGMPKKCDTICWRPTQYFITFIRNLPGGTVLIPGVNANNPIGIQQNLNTIRTALQGGSAPSQKLSKEYVTAQLSLAGAGGQGSPVVFNTYWSMLRCSGVDFAPVTLSNGVVLSPDSLLNDLVDQTVFAIKGNGSADYEKLASIWALLNGKCGN
ncbi:MAG: SdrD B-like domain-containing protein [Blastocatellia bacterium]|nr:SdrD B-like domain-containing protein [Blastocatellia bacterium]